MVWPRRVGDYIISSVLGHGSFGEVRFGRHTYTRKACAVKILQYDALEFDERSRDIRREMSILMALHHPFIIPLYDVIYHKKRLYLVMDLAESDLAAYIRAHGPLSEDVARRYFRQLMEAVLHCHEHGIFHRDIKPENLLLTDKSSILKVADFGFAAVVDKYSSVQPLLKTVCGSGHYCAPEVFQGEGYDGALADTYSCGAVLCSMLFGVQWVDLEEWTDFPEHVSDSVLNLVRGLMQRDSGKRLTLAEARQHPWMLSGASDVSCKGEELNEIDWFPFMFMGA